MYEQRSYLVNGVERTALVSPGEPDESEPPAPTVLFFHGRGAKMDTAAKAGRIRKVWPEATVIYPQGLPNDSGMGPPGIGWQRGFGITGDRDIEFVKEILRTLPTGGKRYACGMSNGGTFALLLEAAMPDALDAFAEVAGAAGRFLNELKIARPTLLINGTSDPILPFWAAQKVLDRLIAISDATPRELDAEKDAAHASVWDSRETLKVWAAPEDPHFLVQWAHPGGHIWPKEADALVVDFFKRH